MNNRSVYAEKKYSGKISTIYCIQVKFCAGLCSNFKLYVLGLENVFYSPQDQTVKEGKGVFFQCVSGESSPPAHITWLKDGTPVRRGRQVKVCVYIPAE